MYANYLLPDISADSVVASSFSGTVGSSSGGGLPVVLTGLGARDPPVSGCELDPGCTVGQAYHLTEADYAVGSTDNPAENVFLITDSFAAAGLDDGTQVSDSSTALVEFIREQLRAPAGADGMRWIALRLSTDSFYGCDVACDSGCTSKRYQWDPNQFSLTITVSDDQSPTSTWVYPSPDAGLVYRSSTEAETMGDTIPGEHMHKAFRLFVLMH